jgi:hypothetical protein
METEINFKELEDKTFQLTAYFERLQGYTYTSEKKILIRNIYINGLFFRDHAFIHMTKYLDILRQGDTFSAQAKMEYYFNPDTNMKDKVGLKRFRKIEVIKRIRKK